MNEFELIQRYFVRPVPAGYEGAGDDCALVPVQEGKQLAVSTDLLIEGRHFLPDVDPAALGHKALAVNVSDLAAMGAEPLGCVLGLSLPKIDHAWLQAFSNSFHQFAESAQCPLVGGDTTRSNGGVVISVTVLGQVDPATALRRGAAQPGQDIWVTGQLGAPHIALDILLGRRPAQPGLLAATRKALEWPEPPWQFAQSLPGVATAALDISDGLLQDLGHILKASQCGASIQYDNLPIDPALGTLEPDEVRHAVLAGGDVYQLCFTALPEHRERIIDLARRSDVRVSRVGSIEAGQHLSVLDKTGQQLAITSRGFDHLG